MRHGKADEDNDFELPPLAPPHDANELTATPERTSGTAEHPVASSQKGKANCHETAMMLWRTMTHLCMFLILTAMHALGLLMHKLCSNEDHSYDFSPASTLVCIELTKLALATALHKREVSTATQGPRSLVQSFRETGTLKLWLATTAIAVMYTANNLLTFFAIAKMDPGKVAIAKALVPYLTGFVLHTCFGRALNSLKWACIILQCCGVAITQFKGSGGTLLSPIMYMWLALSIAITTMSSVYNEYVVKQFKAPLQQINMIMYVVGAFNAAVIYLAVPAYHEKGSFFVGYSPMVVLLILTMSFFGLCVGYAYKYADVLIKNLSTSGSMALLVWLSAMFFDAPLTFNSVTGSVVIITT